MIFTLTHCRGLGLAILFSLAPAMSLNAESARSIDDLAEQIRDTDRQLEALRQTIDQNTLLKRDLQSAFDLAREKRGEREQRLTELDVRINEFNERLMLLDKTIDEASATIAHHRAQLAQSLRSAQSIGARSELKTLLKQDDPAKAQRLAVYREHFFKAQQRQVLAAVDYLKGVEQAQMAALKDRNWLNHIRDKATRQRETYAQNEQSTRQQIDSVDQVLHNSTRSVAQLTQDQQRLQSLMEELESLQRSGSGYFATLQGQLTLPVEGGVTANFGDVKSVGKLRWQGLFIEATDGKAVQAIADGEVVYSDWLQGFGMLVIIDHGDGYMTLYGGNRTVSAVPGAWVESGSTIATVGDAGGQTNSGLYFEIRHNATALDPKDWLNTASG